VAPGEIPTPSAAGIRAGVDVNADERIEPDDRDEYEAAKAYAEAAAASELDPHAT
jgi:hypothetical protein